MARTGVRKAPTKTYMVSGWTTLDGMLELGGDNAQATADDQYAWALRFDFSEVETTIVVKGILIYIVAKKTEVPFSDFGTLYFGVELTWVGNTGGGAATHTSTGRHTTQLTDQWWLYEVGEREEATPWGRTWSRSEFEGDLFQVRIRSLSKSVIGSPTWHIDYLMATIFYDIETPNAYPERDDVTIRESITVSRFAAQNKDIMRIHEAISPAGTAVNQLKSDPDFPTSAQRFERREAFGVMLDFGLDAPTVYIGDALLSQRTDVGYPGNLMQAGLISVGEILAEGDFGGDSLVGSTEITIQNRLYVDTSPGASTTPKYFGDLARDNPLIGKSIKIWAFVESGDGWQQRLMFDWQIEEIEFREMEIIIHAVRVGSGASPVPNIVIDETLFAYEPGSTSDDTGDEIKNNRGKVIPIGLGRFDYGAIKKAADFPLGHPFRDNTETGSPSEDEKTYTAIAFHPALFGVKFPMMPVVHAASRYRRIEGQGENQYVSFTYQNVLLFGSRNGSPHLPVHTGPEPGSLWTSKFPGLDTIPVTRANFNAGEYFLLWTWHMDRSKSVGLPMWKPLSMKWWTNGETDQPPSWAFRENGSDFMERLASKWTDGSASKAYGIFVNELLPETSGLFPEIKRWPGVLQSIAIPFVEPTRIATRTLIADVANSSDPRYNLGTPSTPIFRTVDCDNPDNAIAISDLETYSRINDGGSLSLRPPFSGPGLGKVRGIKFCVLWNRNSTATSVHMLFRSGPTTQYQVWPAGTNNKYYNVDLNLSHNDTDVDGYPDPAWGKIPVMKPSSLARGFASAWMFGFWEADPNVEHQFVEPSIQTTYIDGVEIKYYKIHTMTGEWDFTAWDRRYLHDRAFFQFPFDAMIMASGGYLDVYAFWMEVLFDSPLMGEIKQWDFPGRFQSRVATPPSVRRHSHWNPWGTQVHVPTGGSFEPLNPRQVYFENFIGITVADPSEKFSISGLYVTGKGAVDDQDGSITGTSGRIIENPIDIASALIRHYAGETVFQSRAIGSTHGSFDTARTLLGPTSYRMTIVVEEQSTLAEILKRIGSQSKCWFAEQIDDDGNRVWRVFVDDPDPETNDPDRLYRGDGFGFRWDNFAKGTFAAVSGMMESMASQVVLKHGWHIPSGTWSNELYCNPDGTNFETDAATYVATMAETVAKYGSNLPRATFEAPDIWDPSVGENLCKWHINKIRRRHISVEFDTYANALDLQEGMVIKFDDEIGDREKWPGLGSANWSDHQFNVVHVSARKDAGQFAIVHVVAIETYAEP